MFCLAFAAVAASASAQGVPLQRAVQNLVERGTLPRREGQNPFEPTANPGLPPKEGQLPPQGIERRVFRIIHAGDWEQTGDVVKLTGGTEFEIEGYHVVATEAEGNLRTRVFTLTGDVKIIGATEVIVGQRITVDFRNESYRAFDAEAQLPPQTIGGVFQDHVYVGGGESSGNRRETRTFHGHFTTCNREDPHYHIEGDDIELRHGKRAIFRNLRLKVFGRTIIRIPYLAVPLDDQTYRYLPEVGRSPDEGYYIKNRYGVPLRGGNVLRTRQDYMTKLGLGLGAGYTYSGKSSEGEVEAYGITGRINTLTLSNHHRQRLSFGTLTLDNDFQRNNYLSTPGNTTLSSRAALDLPQRSGNTRLSFNRQSNDTDAYGSSNQTFSIQDTRSFGRTTRTNLDVNYSGNESRSETLVADPNNPGQFIPQERTTERRQIDVRFRGTHELRPGTFSLEYQRAIPVGDIEDFFSTSDRTPVLSFASDSRRLFGPSFNRALPLRMELSVGQFVDPSKRPSTAPDAEPGPDPHVGRAHLDVAMNRRETTAGRLRWDVASRFRQSLYTDDTAQYVLNLNTGVNYRLGHDTSANLRYNYLRPYGYAPLYLDRTGRTNLITADISYRPLRTFIIAAQTGYDINRAREDLQEGQSAWQQVGLRAEYRPYENMMLRSLATYDTGRETLSNVRFDFNWQPGDTLFSLGLRYDGYRHELSNANLLIDNLKIGRLRLSAALQYNGFLKKFEAQQYSFIYDLHCVEAVFTVIDQGYGFRSGREYQFFLRLKALPFDSPFGFGRRGQPIGTGTGRDF